MKPLSRAANCFYFIWDLKVFLDTKFKLQCCYYCCCWGKAGEEASIYSEPVLPSILNQWYHILWTSTIYLFWTSATHITLNQYNLSGHPEPMWPTYNVFHLIWTSATLVILNQCHLHLGTLNQDNMDQQLYKLWTNNCYNSLWIYAHQLHLVNQHATTTLWTSETPVEPNMDQYLELHKIWMKHSQHTIIGEKLIFLILLV